MLPSWPCNPPPLLDPGWELPPERLKLRPDEVHVWLAALDQPPECIERMRSVLTPDELERARRFRFPHLQTRFTAGRAILRLLLGQYLSCGPQAVRFRYGAQGKPELDYGFARQVRLPDLRFNLAHSGEVGVYAFACGRRLGVDIEATRPLDDMEAVARRFFSPCEILVLFQLPPGERTVAFFNCWTRKEAYIKATGKGLSQALDGFTVSLEPGQPARLETVVGNEAETERWRMVDLPAGTAYRAALAVEGDGWSLRRWRWE